MLLFFAGQIYVSTNYGKHGTTYLLVFSLIITTQSLYVEVDSGWWWCCAIYLSNSYGSTFSFSSAPCSWNYNWVSSDASGQYLVAVTDNVGIYYSLNYGGNWTLLALLSPVYRWDLIPLTSLVNMWLPPSAVRFMHRSHLFVIQLWSYLLQIQLTFDAIVSDGSGATIYVAAYDGAIYIGNV